jgi:hypothetical protein
MQKDKGNAIIAWRRSKVAQSGKKKGKAKGN